MLKLLTAAVLLAVAAPLEAQRNCVKGKACGNSCIAQDKVCRLDVAPSPSSEATGVSTVVSGASTPPAAPAPLMLFTVTSMRLRSRPDAQSEAIGTLPVGTPIHPGNCAHGGWRWCAITYEGRAGFVAAQYLVLASDAKAARPATSQRAVSGGGAGSGRYHLGPRGGCYTYSSSGRKRYVDRSLCN